MGFKKDGYNLINEEHKVRIALSKRAQSIMTEDMNVFCATSPSAFINTILGNYCSTAKSSVSLYLQQRTLELDRLFSDTGLDETAKTTAINRIINSEKKAILEDIRQYKKEKCSGRLYHINADNIHYLAEVCDEEEYYNYRPGEYIRSIIEEYCSLPFIKREAIYRKQIYDRIIQACNEKRILKVVANYNGQDQLFYVYPYKIVPDPFHTQSYLVCYSRKADESDNEKIVASFSMARIKLPTMLNKTFHLNKKEINDIETALANNSPAYLIGKPEQIHVRLTEKGKLSYQSRLYSRPEKIPELSNDDIYVFDCTPQQIFNYFFSFGDEAEIISPEFLRNRFQNTYANALSHYVQPPN